MNEEAMRNKITYLLLIIPVFALFSCEKDMPVYNEPDNNNRLNFTFEEERDTLISFTFVYYPEEHQYDTLWMDFETSGYVTDYPRTVRLEQITVEGDNAEAGSHYVAFDDTAVKDLYIIPANQSKAKIPLIVKRDPTLKEKAYTLKIKIGENEYFKPGFPELQTRTYRIADILTRPQNWTGYVSIYCLGKYGDEKYKFMIETGAKRGVIIDEKFFKELVPSNPPDMAYCDFWEGVFRTALEEENKARAERGEGPICEKPKPGEEKGEAIYFKSRVDFDDFQ